MKMKSRNIFVIDTPNIIRYMEKKNPNYTNNVISLISFIHRNETSEFIVIITPWMEKNIPNLSIFKIKNVEIRYSSDYDKDPDVAVLEISRQVGNVVVISNDKFRSKKYKKYKCIISKKIKFCLLEIDNQIFMKCNLFNG